jgi:hypothetical protein
MIIRYAIHGAWRDADVSRETGVLTKVRAPAAGEIEKLTHGAALADEETEAMIC